MIKVFNHFLLFPACLHVAFQKEIETQQAPYVPCPERAWREAYEVSASLYLLCLLIAAGAGDTTEHLVRLLLLAGAFQQAGGPAKDAEDVPVTEAGVSAVSMAVYCDTLFDREIHISIQSSAAEPFEINQAFFKSCFPFAEGCEESVISGERNVLTGYRSRTEEGIAFAGVTSDSRHRVVFYARGLEQAEFDTLVSQMLDESGESVSADIKKSLYVLSDEHIDGLNFLAFTLSKVKNDYAERRGNTLWAQQIVGHWDASFSFDWNGRSCNIGLYNLDYEKNAVENQRLFTAENHVKPDSGICEIELHGMPGWYAENDKRHELSFAQKEYCIAVNSYGDELVSQEELVTLTEQLQIWK